MVHKRNDVERNTGCGVGGSGNGDCSGSSGGVGVGDGSGGRSGGSCGGGGGASNGDDGSVNGHDDDGGGDDGSVSDSDSSAGGFSHLNVQKWFYFVIIATTTIGYGDVVPKTDKGKIFYCCFSVIGIVLMMSLLKSCGAILTALNKRFHQLFRTIACPAGRKTVSK